MRLKPLFYALLSGWCLAVLYIFASTHSFPSIDALFLKEFLHGPTISALFQILGRLLAASLWVFVIVLLGRALWSRIRLTSVDFAEECLLSFGLGAGILMIGLFVLGIL